MLPTCKGLILGLIMTSPIWGTLLIAYAIHRARKRGGPMSIFSDTKNGVKKLVTKLVTRP